MSLRSLARPPLTLARAIPWRCHVLDPWPMAARSAPIVRGVSVDLAGCRAVGTRWGGGRWLRPFATHVVSASDVASVLQEGPATLVDVRSAVEVALDPFWSHAHTHGSAPHDLRTAAVTPGDASAMNDAFLAGVDRSRPVVVFCRSGVRAAAAAATLEALGCSRVVNGGAAGNVEFALGGNVSPAPAAAATLCDKEGPSTSSCSTLVSLPLSLRAQVLGPLDPYWRLARLDRPIGTTLLLWPCVWSIAMAAPLGSLPDAKLLGLFTVGAVVMRGAGCTINDWWAAKHTVKPPRIPLIRCLPPPMCSLHHVCRRHQPVTMQPTCLFFLPGGRWDRDVDGRVARTASRPIASGEVSPAAALAFFAAQSLAGLGVLAQLPLAAVGLGACAVPLVVAYPLAKRHLAVPQLVLGLTFNWGALLGGAAVTGAVTGDGAVWAWALPLYSGAVCWTLVYDTLYAHQASARFHAARCSSGTF